MTKCERHPDYDGETRPHFDCVTCIGMYKPYQKIARGNVKRTPKQKEELMRKVTALCDRYDLD